MKKWICQVCILTCCNVFISSCFYDIESELYPYSTCISINTKYSADVLPILQRSCYSCHSHDNAPLNGNIRLDSYENVLHYVQNGLLMGSLRHEAGYVPMPQDAQKISDCDISKIEAWIADGAMRN